MDTENKIPSPWLYVITLYLPFGILSGFMQQFPLNFFKLMGISNELIGLISGVGIIMSFRFLYAPWLDGISTKRKLSLAVLIATMIIMLAISILIFFRIDVVILFWIMGFILVLMAFCSASYETSADGYYIRALNPKLQAQFIGIKTFAIRFGTLTAVMGLLYVATKIAEKHGAVSAASEDKTGFYIGFSFAYLVAGILMLFFAVWNKFTVPLIEADKPVKHNSFALKEVLGEYFSQKRVAVSIIIILLYRFGQGFLLMRNPFLLDPVEEGGMNTQASVMPFYTFLTDIPWTIIGGIFGGYIIKWKGLKKTFIPLALFMSLPNLFYAWLAWQRPEGIITLLGEDLNIAMLIGSSFESLGYGLSFSAIFYYMHITATLAGRNKTSILAISLCVMNLGFSIPMMASGFVQGEIGYINTFILSSIIGLLAIIVIPFLHIPESA
ncbi:MAG: hypothetical protein ACIAQZ_09695 [Sedimentisphaeraceae bacterium JB056]